MESGQNSVRQFGTDEQVAARDGLGSNVTTSARLMWFDPRGATYNR
jgi:hypothetical protein